MQTQNINANTKYKYTPKTNANRKQIHTERLMQTQKQMHTENTDANMKLQMQAVNTNAKLESHLRLARVSLALFIIPGGIFASANSQTEIDILL